MAKVDAEALNKILELVNDGQVIELIKTPFGYQATVWPKGRHDLLHYHYEGDTLIEEILKIKH